MRTPLLAELLRDVTWPHWREHRVRTALTMLGVALGVATVVGMADVSETVLSSFRHSVDTIAGESALEVTSDSGKLPESRIQDVAGIRGVRAAAGVVESFLPLANDPDELVYVVGVDFLGSPVWESQFPRARIELDDDLDFVSHLDSVILTKEWLARRGLAAGATVSLLAGTGPKDLRVRGVLGEVAAARLFDGALAVMDLPAAQVFLGLNAQVDRVSVVLAEGADVAQVRSALRSALGPGVQVDAPEVRGKQVDQLLFSLRTMLATMSACAVIVGMLIVFHTVAVSIQQRRRQFALLNIAGVPPSLILRLCLVETGMLAALGVVVGLGGGWLLARLASAIVGGAVSDIWVKVDTAEVAFSTVGIGAGIAGAVATAVGATLFAVRATFRGSTVEALRPTGAIVEDWHVTAASILVPLAVAASSWLILLSPPQCSFAEVVTIIIAACGAVYLGGTLVAPALVVIAGRALQRIDALGSWFPARLAIDNLPRDPRRSGATVGTIIVGLAIAANVAGTIESFRGAWLGWIEEHFVSDLIVGAGARMRWFGGPTMPVLALEQLRRVPGVTTVEPFRVLPIEVGGQPAFAQGIAVDDRLARGGMIMVEGSLEAAAPALRAGTGVLVSDSLAFRLGLHVGEPLTLATPTGERTFRIEATYTDYLASIDLGAVGFDYDQMRHIWNDSAVNFFRVWIEPGRSVTEVRAGMLSSLGGHGGYFVITSGEFLRSMQGMINAFFVATWGLQVVAALVAIIGVVNAQLATVLDRASEISTMRTIGVGLRDITRSTLTECAILGALGGVAGILLGTMLGMEIVTVAIRLVTGLRIPFITSPAPLLLGLTVATLVSAVAGYVPARAAARIEARGGQFE